MVVDEAQAQAQAKAQAPSDVGGRVCMCMCISGYAGNYGDWWTGTSLLCSALLSVQYL